MDTLPASLTTHQRSPARRPAPSLTLSDTAHGRPRLHWQQWRQGAALNAPHDATLTQLGTLLQLYNDNGDIILARTPNAGPGATTTTTTITTSATPGAGVAITTNASPAEVTIAWVDQDGTRIQTDFSSNDGQSFVFTMTAATEAQPISHITLVNDGTGDLILHYLMDGTTNIRHTRRQLFAWTAPTTWNRSADAHTITGIHAVHDGGNVQLAITGTQATTEEPALWGIIFGDGALPPNAWGTLIPIITLDPESTSHFSHPGITLIASTAHVTFAWHDGPTTRIHITHPASGDINTGNYLQPYPTPATATHGAILTHTTETTILTEIANTWGSPHPEPRNLTEHLLSATWRYTPTSASATFVLDNSPSPQPSVLNPQAGMDLHFSPGYHSGEGGEAQSGSIRTFRIQSITRSFQRDGRRTITIHATGPFDEAAHWRAPIAYQVPQGTMNRLQLFQMFAALAGIPTTGNPTGWDTQQPGFSLNPGESAQTALARLLAPTETTLRHEAGSLELIDPPQTSEEDYSPTAHPIEEAHQLEEAPQTNWLRVHGDEHTADAHNLESLSAHGPRFRVERHLSADTDALAEAYAEAALSRQSRLSPRLRLRAPYHAGQRLYDIVHVQLAELELDNDYRVISIENHYQRSPGQARYDTTLTLAEA